MSKKNIRLLALGFFLSGLVLALSYLFLPTTTEANQQHKKVEELESEVAYLESQIAEMEVAQVEAQSTEDTEEKPETEAEENNEGAEEDNQDGEDENSDESEQNSEEDSEENSEQSDEEEPVINTSVTIGEGQPSSVAARQLMEQNIIEDRFDFDRFLEENNYAPLVRPGTYEINSNMNYEEIAQALMGR